MTSRERVRRALTFQTPDRVPRQLWALPGVIKTRNDEYESLLSRFPLDFGDVDVKYGRGRRIRGVEYEVGTNVDAWGCVWHVAEPGVLGEVKAPPLADWSSLDSWQLPWELLREADFSKVNSSYAASEKFIIGGGQTRPFERMQFLRGTENLFLDLAYGSREVFRLRDMLHEFFCEEMRMWAATDVDAVGFMDDWGTQRSLLVSPSFWRSFFKPLYKDYCDIIRGSGKFVFFHSDGNIESIYPDLIEIGITAVNSQLFCMDIEKLGRLYKGKITFNGEIDRQRVLPFGTVEDVRAAVRRVRNALWDPRGGVIAECEWGIRDPKENIEAVFDEWNKPPA